MRSQLSMEGGRSLTPIAEEPQVTLITDDNILYMGIAAETKQNAFETAII